MAESVLHPGAARVLRKLAWSHRVFHANVPALQPQDWATSRLADYPEVLDAIAELEER